jgi:hypothetical protein
MVITGLVVPTATLPKTPAAGVITSVFVGDRYPAALAPAVERARQTVASSARKLQRRCGDSGFGR